jgi:hypothetical protein
METSPERAGLFNALVFSLLWTDRIYENVPPDRLRLIVTSYTLIALGLVAAFVKIGSGLMPLVVSGALVLGAVNLVTWVISLERGEKETLQTELKLAHDVQVSLMPKSDPSLPGFEVAGISVPAANVGGGPVRLRTARDERRGVRHLGLRRLGERDAGGDVRRLHDRGDCGGGR